MRAAGYKAVVHAKIIIASKITQPSSPASLLVTGLDLNGHGSSHAAVYRVVPYCSCYRCVDLSRDRVLGDVRDEDGSGVLGHLR